MIDQIWKKKAQIHRSMKMVGGGGKIRFFSGTFSINLKMVQLGFAEIFQLGFQRKLQSLAQSLKNFPEFSPKELEEFWNWNIWKVWMVHILHLQVLTYARPVSWYFLLSIWFELKIIFCLKEWKIKTSTETVNRLLSCPHTNNIKFAPLTCCKIMNHCRPKLLIRGCDQAAPGWGNSRVKYEYFRELMPHCQAFRFAGKITCLAL